MLTTFAYNLFMEELKLSSVSIRRHKSSVKSEISDDHFININLENPSHLAAVVQVGKLTEAKL